MKKNFVACLITSFVFLSCSSGSPLVKTWQTTYEENGKTMRVESVLGKETFNSYATWDNVPRTEIMRGKYQATDKEITLTATHEYNHQTKKLEELKEPRVYADAYTVSKDTLELGKQLFKKK